jgi:hypothetical protein
MRNCLSVIGLFQHMGVVCCHALKVGKKTIVLIS